MINKLNQNMVIDNAVKAVAFIHNRKKPFTVKELSDSIGLSNPQGGKKYLDALSSHYQIYEHSKYSRCGGDWGSGAIPAEYGIVGITDK